jgi:hypothetical protein
MRGLENRSRLIESFYLPERPVESNTPFGDATVTNRRTAVGWTYKFMK